MDHAVDVGIHHAVDAAPHPAVHIHRSGGALGGHRRLQLKAGLFHNDIAHQQDLGQDEHDQEHGDQGAPADALTDAHNGGLGGYLADEESGGA